MSAPIADDLPVQEERGRGVLTIDQPRQHVNFAWCLRHFAWVLLVCILLGAAAALRIAPSQPTYQADALVVARQLVVNQKVLPNLATTLFADGAVAAKVATDPSLHGKTDGLVPDRLSVVPGQDSIVLDVQARDADPATAARLANLAAVAFVDELNRPGAGVGQFSVQSQATVPTTPLREFSEQVRTALGALAGFILGLGVLALIGVLRAPIVKSQDVTAALGVPLLGTVEVHRAARGAYLGPRGVRGIATVTRWLTNVPAGRLILVSARSTVGLRRRIYVMLGVALSTFRPVRFQAPEDLVAAIREHSIPLRRPETDAAPREPAGELVLVDGGSPLDVADPADDSLSVVAVAPRGLSRRRLRALASDYIDSGLVGIILVRRRVGLRKTVRVVTPAASTTRTTRASVAVPEPERA